MIKIDEETKQALAKYVGPDGRLIIDENLPDDIKEAFEFFNQEGINILDFPENLHFAPPADEEDVFADGEDEPTEVDKLLEKAYKLKEKSEKMQSKKDSIQRRNSSIKSNTQKLLDQRKSFRVGRPFP